MLYARDFRKQAYDALAGRWAVAVGTGFVAALLGAQERSPGIPNASNHNNYENFTSMYHNPLGWAILWGIFSFVLLYAFLMFFIGGAIKLGYSQFNLNLINGSNPYFGDLFSKFNMFWKGFCMQFLIGLFIFLWTLLLIIPGIIAAYRYSMTSYILLENPDMTVMDAITRSKEMMRGNKARLFCLDISFIGWWFLCILTCGIGFLWLHLYMNAASAAFYNEVSGRNSGRYHDPNGFDNTGSNNWNNPNKTLQ